MLLPTVPIKRISRTVLAFILSRTSGMNGQKLKRDEKFGLISSKLAKRVLEPSKSSTLCSNHFKPEDFERRFHILPGQTKPNFQKLRADDLGVCVFPSIHATPKAKQVRLPTTSPRNRRMVSSFQISIDVLHFPI